MKRRQFLTKIVSGSSFVVAAPLFLQSCEKDDTIPDNPGGGNPGTGTITIDLTDSKYTVLNNPGGSVKEGSVIVFNDNGNFVALSSICTHQGCTVSYNAASDTLPCPCHGSVFSASGSVLQGPATQPLKKYTVMKDGDILTIS